MTIKEAVSLLSYGTAYEIQGAYSGEIYHRSYISSSKNLDKYADREVTDSPFYTTLKVRGDTTTNGWCIAVIGIWMHDYDMRKDDEDLEDATATANHFYGREGESK